jgi:APA family basic amino acid/polyamine antiporter
MFKQLFARKSLETLHAEALGDNRLRRILGPVGLTSLGIGAIIGAGIFVMTGRVAADNAGPAVMVSYAVAGLGCALAAFCYAEFAAMAPVAGSAYTYAYATLGELFAWIIGWDLILEYAMSCATVASAWSEYLNKLTHIFFNWQVPEYLSNDPFSKTGAIVNLPAMIIMIIVTTILVIGIRESAASNTVLVVIKLGVVLFVIAMGFGYINRSNWTDIPPEMRKLPTLTAIKSASEEYVEKTEKLTGTKADDRAKELQVFARAVLETDQSKAMHAKLKAENRLDEGLEGRLVAIEKKYVEERPTKEADLTAAVAVLSLAEKGAPSATKKSWGLLGTIGLDEKLKDVDEKTRSNFMPYGISGVMLGAALVFFAFIGFDSISTHAEEAIKPQRDVPIGILASLAICTVLYMAVSAIITGMQPYFAIDTKAAIAAAFDDRAKIDNNPALKWSAGLIALGGLAGMTSVLLITFLSQARIFLAMARDGLMSQRIFGTVHPKFRTPHISTMVTGAIIIVVAGFTPIGILEEMVNIGTLFAFVVVCAAVMLLRMRRPEVHRPFRCPALFIVAPVGIVVNVLMMLFLPIETWVRLVVWLGIGLLIYFGYGMWHSVLGQRMRGLMPELELPDAGGMAPKLSPADPDALKKAAETGVANE